MTNNTFEMFLMMFTSFLGGSSSQSLSTKTAMGAAARLFAVTAGGAVFIFT